MAGVMLLFGELPAAQAQFTEFRFGVNGLTCSQCTRSVEQQLKKLDFVAQVSMDLEHTTGKIIPKAGTTIRPKAIAKAISDAGFSIRFLQADFNTDGWTQQAAPCFIYQRTAYYLKEDKLPTSGVLQVVFLDPVFSAGKPWLRNKKQTPLPVKQTECRAKEFYFIALQKS